MILKPVSSPKVRWHGASHVRSSINPSFRSRKKKGPSRWASMVPVRPSSILFTLYLLNDRFCMVIISSWLVHNLHLARLNGLEWYIYSSIWKTLCRIELWVGVETKFVSHSNSICITLKPNNVHLETNSSYSQNKTWSPRNRLTWAPYTPNVHKTTEWY